MNIKSSYVILGLGTIVLASVVIQNTGTSSTPVAQEVARTATAPATTPAAPTAAPATAAAVTGEVLVFKVEGMTCGSCEQKITRALKGQSRVGRVEVNVARGLVAVEALSEAAQVQTLAHSLAQTVTDAGFPATFAGKLDTMPNDAKTQSKGGCGSGCCS